MIALRQAAALWSDRLVAHFGSTTFDTNALAGAVADEQAGDYVRLAAALELVLRGDRAPATIALLRRVLDDGMFALTNSLIERGQAALALALAGDVASRDRIAAITPINGNDRMRDLALRVLSG
ncbi:MAG: hypothetical protein KC503_42915 [Myxococcales bacterium]|nr:hypothetical protein [Myxococcales bacterium]